MTSQNLSTKIPPMVLGVLDIAAEISDQAVAQKYRDLTISWSRYDYRNLIIEASSVNAILDRASQLDYHRCLILPYGHIIAERWTPDHWQIRDFWTALHDLLDRDDFLVAGNIVEDADHWFGFENQCLVVNVDKYRLLSEPQFDCVCSQPTEVPGAQRQREQGRISALLPASVSSAERELKQPSLLGWNFIATSLGNGIPVVGCDDAILGGVLDLSANDPRRTRSFARYLGQDIKNFDRRSADPDLGQDQVSFLSMVQPQTTSAPNGVFLWNIESYADIEHPCDDFNPPIRSLYCVAAGFKPNRILQTHAFDASTRMVYFDYSPKALEVKRYMIDHWDGENYPEFVEHLMGEFPHPETFYQLWGDLTPDNVTRADIEQMWQRELRHWGGESNFREHWRAYRKIPHEFICCNLLTDPSVLVEQIVDEPDAVIWWSNAFFTMYGNWFYSPDERQQIYERWIRELAARNPGLHLFGSDHNNVNVNSVRAGEYWEAYRRSECNCLNPFKMSKVELRM